MVKPTHNDRGPPDYEAWVREALEQPGKIHQAYSLFWEFSLGNQMLAMMQLPKPEPIANFNKWKELGRHVKRGEKAIGLLMPVTRKKETEDGQEENRTFFMLKHYWFGLSQTEGAEYTPPPIPGFSITRAAENLGITIESFQSINGNVQGYAKTDEKIIAVSPLAYNKRKTFFHEAAHVLLHPRSLELPKMLREGEAELASYLVSCALGHTENLEFSRGYIRNWLGNDGSPKLRYPEVFKTVDAILRAGRDPEPAPERPAYSPQPAREMHP